MKLRLASKLVHGKPRWYVVRSYRDEQTGQPRTAWVLYLGEQPTRATGRFLNALNRRMEKQPEQAHILAMEAIEQLKADKL